MHLLWCALLVIHLILVVLGELTLAGLVLVARVALILVLHGRSVLILLSGRLILLVLGAVLTAHRGVRLAELIHVSVLRLRE